MEQVDGAVKLISSPVGTLAAHAEGGCITELSFPGRSRMPAPASALDNSVEVKLLGELERQLGEYFAGDRTRFDLPLRTTPAPEFHRRVWEELVLIPFGETISYGELARRIGDPTASRAVGAANGANPIAIVIPCHRVIGADGRLVGYGGGLTRKRFLLDLESGRQRLAL